MAKLNFIDWIWREYHWYIEDLWLKSDERQKEVEEEYQKYLRKE